MKTQFNSINKFGNRSLLVISSIPLALLISSFSRVQQRRQETYTRRLFPYKSHTVSPDFSVVSLHKGAFVNVTDTFRTNIFTLRTQHLH